MSNVTGIGRRRWFGAAVLCVVFLALIVGLRPAFPVNADAACDAMPVGLIGSAPSFYGNAVRVDVQGNYAYVVDWSGNLEIFDNSDPCHPTSMGSAQWYDNEFQDVKVVGDYAYVANDANGLAKYDVSDPSAPTRVSARHDSGGYAVSVDHGGGYLFVSKLYSANPGLLIYDATTFPSGTPVTYSMGSSYPYMWEVDIEGDRAYLFNSGYYTDPRFQILDISTLPSQPVLLGSINLPTAIYGHGFGLKVTGDHAYLSAPAVDSLSVDGGLVIINIANSSNPFVEGMVTIPNAALNFWKRPGLDVVGDMAYMPGSDGLYGFDVSDPSNPIQTEYYPYPPAFGSVSSGDVAIVGNFAYVSLFPQDSNTGLGHGGLAVYKLRANNAPVAVDDSYATDEEKTLVVDAPGVLGNDTDGNGDPLSAVLVDDVDHGDLTLNSDGSFSYAPAAGYVGSDSFSYKAYDGSLYSAEAVVKIDIDFAFTGFFPPVDNPPTLNSVKAGSAVPAKFSLGGDYGLGIIATGYPKSVKIACDSGVPIDTIEETVTAGNSSLQYNPATGQYTYVWKTDKAWANTCRQFQLMLADGTLHVANFKFR
jgi:hypothetical protein